MNALISAFKDKQKIMFANEGRLLKKSFFGLLILVLAFQTRDFGDVIRESMVNAYLAVSVFVGFTLIVFIGLDSLTKFDIGSFLDKTKKLHVPIASFLGAIPGCGGAIIVVTQYIQGRISFGSLVAVGAIAKKVLENRLGKKYKVIGAVTQLGILGCDTKNWNDKLINKNPFFCPDKSILKLWEKYLLGIRKSGSSCGAVIEVRAGAIGAWLDAKGTFEPEIAKRVLLEQGMDGFVAQLEKAGAL